MIIKTLKLLLVIIVLVLINDRVSSQIQHVKKSIYYLIDTLSNNKKNTYKIRNAPVHNIFGSIITFDYPCYYNGEYSPEFLQFKKTIKTISKKDVKQFPLMSTRDFLELICKNGVGGGVLFTDYDIYFVERLKKRKYLLYKVMSSAPPRIE